MCSIAVWIWWSAIRKRRERSSSTVNGLCSLTTASLGDSADEESTSVRQLSRITIWRLCCGGIALIAIVTFSPLVIPSGRYEPMLAGLPLTFWAGALVIAAIAFLTNLGAYVHPGRDSEDSDKP